MLTALQDWQSLDTAHIIWCLGTDCATHWLLFPMIRGSHVNGCRKPLKRLKYSLPQRQRDRNGTMIGKLMPSHWNQVTWSWPKLTPTGGRRKVKGQWEEDHMKCSTRLLKASLPTLWGTSGPDAHKSSIKNQLFLITPTEGTPLYTVVWAKWARCTTTTLEEQTP